MCIPDYAILPLVLYTRIEDSNNENIIIFWCYFPVKPDRLVSYKITTSQSKLEGLVDLSLTLYIINCSLVFLLISYSMI